MNNEFKEVDIFIQKSKDEAEMKNYMNNNVFPTYFHSSSINSINPCKLDDIMLPEIIKNIDVDKNNQRQLLTKVNDLEFKIRETIKRETDREKEREENNCPICLEDLGEKNLIIPNCGHKVCINCFVINIRHNNIMSNACCLCRMEIVSSI